MKFELNCTDNDVPISGTASDVGGIVSATSCRKTVSERRIVTPADRVITIQFIL